MTDQQDGSQPKANEESRAVAPTDGRRRPPLPTVVVRYGRMGHVGEFVVPKNIPKIPCGMRLVVQTERGVEIGEPLSCTHTSGPNAISKDQMRAYAKNSGPDFLRARVGRVLREALPDDLVEEKHILGQKDEKMNTCRELIARHGLEMRLVDCEHIFGGERVVFYFTAENRVDFRGLVRDLADEFQTRIEMRQIGARDEARLIADFETCGRECCCRNFLKSLKPVSMRMAKLQKATLDPSKVSGRCGRLKCCLRYEHDTYEELDRRLPRVGQRINSTEGAGVVVERQVLAQLLRIQSDESKQVVVSIETLLPLGETPPASEPPPTGPPERPRSRRDPRDNRGRPRPDGDTTSSPNGDAAPAPGNAAPASGDRPSKQGDDSTAMPKRRKRRRGRRARARKDQSASKPAGD